MEITENESGGVWSKLADCRVSSLFLWGNLASKSEIEPLGVGEENVQCIYMEHKIIPLLVIIQNETPIY